MTLVKGKLQWHLGTCNSLGNKVRNVDRLIYKMIIQMIGLNAVYLLMLNNDSTNM